MYPIVERWRSTRAKSATIEEIKEVTGHTNKMVTNRALDGTLKKTSRKPNAYTMESIIKWLSTAPVPRSKNAEKEDVQLSVEVPQTPPVEVQVNDIENDMQTDENEADDLTDTGEHEVITEEVLEEGMNALKDLDLRDYQPVPKALEMSA
jgi:phage terminase small subunit